MIIPITNVTTEKNKASPPLHRLAVSILNLGSIVLPQVCSLSATIIQFRQLYYCIHVLMEFNLEISKQVKQFSDCFTKAWQ